MSFRFGTLIALDTPPPFVLPTPRYPTCPSNREIARDGPEILKTFSRKGNFVGMKTLRVVPICDMLPPATRDAARASIASIPLNRP
eukprot:1232150-Amorphochlora_amoeboformis.AAC.1